LDWTRQGGKEVKEGAQLPPMNKRAWVVALSHSIMKSAVTGYALALFSNRVEPEIA
jgi:hypothetical protein